MSWQTRIPVYAEIEERRKRPLIAYVTSKRENISAQMATDALPSIIDQLDKLPKNAKAIDLMIVSFGGDPMVAWRIMSLVRQRVTKVSVLIPQSAYSAATLLAIGANEIVMHPNGHLGPVDMQIRTQAKRFSTEDISAFIEFVREELKIKEEDQVRPLFEKMCDEIGSLAIGFTARNSKLAIDLGERLLALHLKNGANGKTLRKMVEEMSKKFHSHSYPVNRDEAIEIGLPVNKKRDAILETKLWELWLDIEEELKERIPFDPLIELMNSSQAAKLTAPVLHLDLPMVASSSAHFSTTISDVKTNLAPAIDPVDFSCLTAVVESRRMTNKCITRGKILSCRAPDMSINYNAVTSYRGWEKLEQQEN